MRKYPYQKIQYVSMHFGAKKKLKLEWLELAWRSKESLIK